MWRTLSPTPHLRVIAAVLCRIAHAPEMDGEGEMAILELVGQSPRRILRSVGGKIDALIGCVQSAGETLWI